jgi:hypothetical protein
MKYIRICKGIKDKGILVPESELTNVINSTDTDWYVSLFLYNDLHFSEFQKKKSVAGFTGLVTDKLVFDFDSKENIDLAKDDALTVYNRLIQYGFTDEQINICFSGNKGFSLETRLSSSHTTSEIKSIAKQLAGDCDTWDTVIYNENRLFRAPYTRHPSSGLFKLPISIETLSEADSATIKTIASDLDNAVDWKSLSVELPKELLPKSEEVVVVNKNAELSNDVKDLVLKVKWLPPCREAILNGYFKSGNRSNALMSLCASIAAQGLPKEVAYRMLKGAAELQSRRTGDEQFDKDEIWNNIIRVVYSPTWQGKTYACKDHEFLQEICPSKDTCKKKDNTDLIKIEDLSTKFKDFAVNIEKNRVYTGIQALDEKIVLTTSMLTGILGAPGSAKTALAFNMLHNTSLAGTRSVFCSLDMGWPLVYARLISRLSGHKFEDVIETYKQDKDHYREWDAKLAGEFKNVDFWFRSGTTVEDIKQQVLKRQEQLGEKIKLVVIDYLELLVGPYSDPTANGAFLATQLKDLSTDLEACVVVLVQPPKSAGDASTPLYSMRQVKGASVLEQNFRTIFGVYREGFSPDTPQNDKYITINCLKNTLGGLFSLDFGWEGVTGKVKPLSYIEQEGLEDLRESKKEKKTKNNDDW